jgi:ATP-dependent Lhr-like helicase
VQTAVVVERMRGGQIEALRVPANPLDVLAQQIVAMLAMEPWSVDDLEALVRRAAPFSTLTRGVLEAVLDMLAGRYPSDAFAELKLRLVWDRDRGLLTARPGAHRIAVINGGTIPDRGLYGVFLAGGGGPGRRVGELDEEMVYESRIGDVFALGSTSWQIVDITHDQVLVTPAPGRAGKLPFWHGDTVGRPREFGQAIGATIRQLRGSAPEQGLQQLAALGLDANAASNALAYLDEQHEVCGVVPDDRTIVVERFRDEIGDWRLVVHSLAGGRVNTPWALALAARLRNELDIDVQVMPSDDGIVLRLPDLGGDDETAPDRVVGPGRQFLAVGVTRDEAQPIGMERQRACVEQQILALDESHALAAQQGEAPAGADRGESRLDRVDVDARRFIAFEPQQDRLVGAVAPAGRAQRAIQLGAHPRHLRQQALLF